MNKQKFGFSKLSNEDVFLYEIANTAGMKVNILSFGAAVQSIYLPWKGKNNSKESVNVVLGYSNVEDYEINDCYIGVAVGRVAGRISHGQFKLQNKCCEVTKNNDKNCLHGGRIGISRKNWSLVNQTVDSVCLQCVSHHNEEGFPGEMKIDIKYTVAADNSLIIEYAATVDEHACPINLTNHSYFNLSGIDNVDRGIRDHIVEINSSKTLELGGDLLPTGKVVPVSKVLNLKNNKERLEKQLPNVGEDPKGFDNYYIFDQVGLDHCQAIVTDGITKLMLFTDQNGVQFYTSNFFDHVKCSHGHVHKQHGALCLEAQNYPDAINHPDFPDILLQPGQHYSQKSIYKFEKV